MLYINLGNVQMKPGVRDCPVLQGEGLIRPPADHKTVAGYCTNKQNTRNRSEQ